MPSPITAEQLAATLLQRREIDTALFRFDPACDVRLEYSDWNHILHCLREHEERAARANEIHWEANGDGTHSAIRNFQVVGKVSWGGHEMDGYRWQAGSGEWTLAHSLTDAKAAVEKGVRP